VRKPFRKIAICTTLALGLGSGLAACSSFNDLFPGNLQKITPFAENYQALGALSVATIIVTDKTIIDHFVSYFREEDCSTVRASMGDTYCRPIRVAYVPPPEPFCYRSLAEASCFATPNPYGTDHRMGSYLPGITRTR